jgi:hypothetical protein
MRRCVRSLRVRLESAGFRARQPCDKAALAIVMYDDDDTVKMHAFLIEDADSVALVCFAVPLVGVRELLPPYQGERWLLPSHRIPELNRQLRDAVVVAMRRNDDQKISGLPGETPPPVPDRRLP